MRIAHRPTKAWINGESKNSGLALRRSGSMAGWGGALLGISLPLGLRELLDGLKGLFDRLGDFIDGSLLTQLRDLKVVREFWQVGLHC